MLVFLRVSPNMRSSNRRRIRKWNISLPKQSMYGIFTYIWLIFVVNVAKYTIHGSYGLETTTKVILKAVTWMENP